MNIEINNDLGVQVYLQEGPSFMSAKSVAIDVSGGDGMYTGDMTGDVNAGMGGAAKDPLLSEWPFVIGISFLTLAVGVVIGILLAKRKIKKGIELYED